MAAPSKSWTDIADSRIDVDSPATEELKTFERDNAVHNDERIGIPAAPGNRTANHRHRGLDVDGSEVIELTPQENLVAGSDGIDGGGGSNPWSTSTDVAAGSISFHNGGTTSSITPRRIRRSDGSNFEGVKKDRKAIHKAVIDDAIEKKIKSASGKGRFTCSIFVKRVAAASGVVGGTLRFGLHTGGSWIADAFVDVDFDDVTTEYKRFFFISNQIARPSAIRARMELTADPSDWDTISNDDLVGYAGGFMITNGEGLAKWDISHLDGGGDEYLDPPTDDEIYWWDEAVDIDQQAVV